MSSEKYVIALHHHCKRVHTYIHTNKQKQTNKKKYEHHGVNKKKHSSHQEVRVGGGDYDLSPAR